MNRIVIVLSYEQRSVPTKCTTYSTYSTSGLVFVNPKKVTVGGLTREDTTQRWTEVSGKTLIDEPKCPVSRIAPRVLSRNGPGSGRQRQRLPSCSHGTGQNSNTDRSTRTTVYSCAFPRTIYSTVGKRNGTEFKAHVPSPTYSMLRLLYT